jgi:hypothetical protein
MLSQSDSIKDDLRPSIVERPRDLSGRNEIYDGGSIADLNDEEVTAEVAARLGKDDWSIMDEEVDAVMNESDDDDGEDENNSERNSSDSSSAGDKADEDDGFVQADGTSSQENQEDLAALLEEELEAVLDDDDQVNATLYSPEM